MIDGDKVPLFKAFVEASTEHREAMSNVLLAVATEMRNVDKSTKTQTLIHWQFPDINFFETAAEVYEIIDSRTRELIVLRQIIDPNEEHKKLCDLCDDLLNSDVAMRKQLCESEVHIFFSLLRRIFPDGKVAFIFDLFNDMNGKPRTLKSFEGLISTHLLGIALKCSFWVIILNQKIPTDRTSFVALMDNSTHLPSMDSFVLLADDIWDQNFGSEDDSENEALFSKVLKLLKMFSIYYEEDESEDQVVKVAPPPEATKISKKRDSFPLPTDFIAGKFFFN